MLPLSNYCCPCADPHVHPSVVVALDREFGACICACHFPGLTRTTERATDRASAKAEGRESGKEEDRG